MATDEHIREILFPHNPHLKPMASFLKAAIENLRTHRNPVEGHETKSTEKSPNSHALVLLDTSKLIKKSMQQSEKSSAKIEALQESLERYRVEDTKSFEDWKKQALKRQFDRLDELREAIEEIAKKIRALDGDTPKSKRKKHVFEDFTKEENFESKENKEEAGRAEYREDYNLSRYAWILLHTCLDIIDEELSSELLQKLQPGDLEEFVTMSFFPTPALVLQRKEEVYLKKRICAYLIDKLKLAQKAAQPETMHAADLELKMFYWKIAKKLHPDKIVHMTDIHRKLWDELQAAHAQKDLERIKQVEVQYAFYFEKDKSALSLSDLKIVNAKKKEEIAELKSELKRAQKNVDFGFSDKDDNERRRLASMFKQDMGDRIQEMEEFLCLVKAELSLKQRLEKSPGAGRRRRRV